jgi:pyruvate,water dikinase
VLERLAAVVTDTGSKASHFASVAREFGLPWWSTPNSPPACPGGTASPSTPPIGLVYDGVVPALRERARRPRPQRDTPFRRRMAEVMGHIAPLNLTDPGDESFAPSGCRTIHDIVRFCHERGVGEMFSLVGKGGRGLAQAKLLETPLPVVLHVLDLGGGLVPAAAEEKTVDPCHFASGALIALWEGLNHPDVQWDGSLLAFDWERFDQMSGGVFSLKSKVLSSYVVVAREYMHLLMRFGYHFAVVDAMCGEHPEANYVNFRFKGGGAGVGQRLLRLDFVKKVLASAGFRVKVTGDMLDARLDRAPAPKTS